MGMSYSNGQSKMDQLFQKADLVVALYNGKLTLCRYRVRGSANFRGLM